MPAVVLGEFAVQGIFVKVTETHSKHQQTCKNRKTLQKTNVNCVLPTISFTTFLFARPCWKRSLFTFRGHLLMEQQDIWTVFWLHKLIYLPPHSHLFLHTPQVRSVMSFRRWMSAWWARKPAFALTATWSLPECFALVTAVEKKMPVRYGKNKLHYTPW